MQQMPVADHQHHGQSVTAPQRMPDQMAADVLNGLVDIVEIRFHGRAKLQRGRIVENVFFRRYGGDMRRIRGADERALRQREQQQQRDWKEARRRHRHAHLTGEKPRESQPEFYRADN